MPKKLKFCVYILLSQKDDNFYIGFTTDLKRRLTDHFTGQVASIAHRRPLNLIHCEYYFAESDALRREAYLKTTKGKRTLRLMLRDALSEFTG
jgi:putative endonuclease